MANKEYNQAIGRRKETSAVLKLFKGTGIFSISTPAGIKTTLQGYFGGNDYLYQQAIYGTPVKSVNTSPTL